MTGLVTSLSLVSCVVDMASVTVDSVSVMKAGLVMLVTAVVKCLPVCHKMEPPVQVTGPVCVGSVSVRMDTQASSVLSVRLVLILATLFRYSYKSIKYKLRNLSKTQDNK